MRQQRSESAVVEVLGGLPLRIDVGISLEQGAWSGASNYVTSAPESGITIQRAKPCKLSFLRGRYSDQFDPLLRSKLIHHSALIVPCVSTRIF